MPERMKLGALPRRNQHGEPGPDLEECPNSGELDLDKA